MGNARFVETTRKRPPHEAGSGSHVPVLVIAHHPALARIGESLAIHEAVEVSRLAPVFGSALAELDPSPLDDPFVSRTPFRIAPDGDGLAIENPSGVELAIAGRAVGPLRRITAEELAHGIELVLGDRIVLWLTRDHAGASDELAMLGSSRALHALRAEIRALGATARTRGPILVEGETGVGKELVARAIHAVVRPDRPFVAVNVAAIPAAVAAAELFGHDKGAFTGATERRAGHFERAAGGVLFLDEIGDLPEAVQPVLLRALESGEIQPLGGQPRTLDVLVVAATDADLARAAAAGRYKRPLYYRLAGTTLRVPPLRERRVDLGPLLARFLRDDLDARFLDHSTEATPWLPASLVAELLRAPWPGNIRQLRAVAARLASLAHAGRVATLADLGLDDLGLDDLGLDDLGGLADPEEPATPSAAPSPTTLDEPHLVATLRRHRFQLARTAEALGISRTHLDALIARSQTLRKAKDLARDEIVACAAEHADDVDAMAAALEVSPRGLRLRMRQLGL